MYLGGGTGRRQGLDNLSAQKETFDVEPRKFGEPFYNGNTEPSLSNRLDKKV